ncbi:MAG TPA: carbohydrate ABC transporter permease [Clostridiaceae bacterium]|nr:carbohydrate ABC transporter permease [Clostridiaceae bacterium]
MKKSPWFNIFSFTVLGIAILISMFPIYWMIITSFKPMSEIYLRKPTFWPQKFTLSNYIALFTETTYLRGISNSIIVAMTVATFTIIVSLPASYSIARLKFKGKLFASRIILYTYLIPAAVLYIPLFVLMTNIGLTNSLYALMLIYPTFTIPYATWILIPYLGSIPFELEEAALVDGCKRISSMVRIVLPLASPGIVTTFIFSFTQCWGEFLHALVNISDKNLRTFPLVINALIWGDLYPWGQIMAGGIVACLPILIIYMVASNALVGGLTAGSIKQ